MSHEATFWAFKQMTLGAYAWRILALLADCHNPDPIKGGCFPSQRWLARYGNMSPSSVNRQLTELEELGLIRRVRKRHPVTNAKLATHYRLAFEAGFEPLPVAHHVPEGDIGGHVPAEGSTMSPSGTLICKEPLNPLPPDDDDDDDEPTPDLGVVETDGPPFADLVAKWPLDKHGKLHHAEISFAKLPVADRQIAIDTAQPTLIAMVRMKRGIPHLRRYVEARLFDEFHNAPAVDKDGDFVITPDRPEWRDWMGWVRKAHGQRGVDYHVKLGRMVTKHRWPTSRATSPAPETTDA